MNVVEISEPGDPDVLVMGKRSIPTPQSDEILIKVAYCGVNRPDCIQRLGHYPPPRGASDIPGLEVSGTIIAVGKYVVDFDIGDQVCALVPGGGYAQYCVVHARNVLPVPDGLSLAEAAVLPETFFTVWHNVFQRAQLKKDERFLVHGGSSGIGTTAIMLAKAFGAEVFTTAGSDQKCEFATNLGADIVINYKTHDFVDVIRHITQKQGVNVILDMIGGDYVNRNYRIASVDGRIVQIAFQRGRMAQADFALLMSKRLTHTGSTLRAQSVGFKAKIADELLENVWPLIEAGTIKPVIYACFDMQDAAQAHRIMESSVHMGKIVLSVDPSVA